MSSIIISETDDVDRHLKDLGLRRSWLDESVRQGELQRRLATNLDPKPTGGFNAWTRTCRVLRETLVVETWFPTEEFGIPTVVNPEETVKIIFSSGDRFTGRTDGRDPKTKNTKGAATARIVRTNVQQSWDDLEGRPEPTTWVLLFHSGPKGLFAELSCPGQLSAKGKIEGWSHRIVLGQIDLGDDFTAAAPIADTPSDPIDVPVTRRSA